MAARARSTTDARFRFDVLGASGPVLVDFTADWCPTCRRLDPVLDELAARWGGHPRVLRLDVERNPAMTARYGVMGLPTLILFDGGEERARLVGVVRAAAIEEGLAPWLAQPPAA